MEQLNLFPGDDSSEWVEVFCTSFWHARAKRRIYAAPGKTFHFWIKRKRD